MSYLTHVLLPGETVIHEAKLHWLIYIRAILLFLAACLVAVLSTFAGDVAVQQAILGLAGVILLIALVDALRAAIRRATTEFAVTNHRVIYKRGLISRFTIEMNRDKVESVNVRQSLLGRIFNYGTLLIRGTGGSLEPFRNVADPLTMRSRITVP